MRGRSLTSKDANPPFVLAGAGRGPETVQLRSEPALPRLPYSLKCLYESPTLLFFSKMRQTGVICLRRTSARPL